MKYKSPAEITDEIRRVVPLYAGVSLDGTHDRMRETCDRPALQAGNSLVGLSPSPA
jgi:predicted molibdopterin-dependent oxidoreductase YjgC